MAINPPKSPKSLVTSEIRHADCQEQLEPVLRQVVEEADLAGWCPTESINAIEALVARLRACYPKRPTST